MSQENAASLRDNIDALDRRDRAAFFSGRDPACEVIPDRSWPESGAIRGRQAVWEFYVSVAETFGMDSREAEIIDAGGDKVVIHLESQARGRTSGVEVMFDWSNVVTFREGKIVRDQWFADRAEALEAAGLSE